MKKVMIDLETMSTRSNAAVLSIGAVAFDVESGQIGPEFCRNVDLDSSIKAGLVVDADTMRWWLQQNEQARAALFTSTSPLPRVLMALEDFLRQFPDAEIWCNGGSFDFPILKNAFGAVSITAPWHFRNERDMRTIVAIAKDLTGYQKPEHKGIAHSALDDAKHQAQIVIECYQRLSALQQPKAPAKKRS